MIYSIRRFEVELEGRFNDLMDRVKSTLFFHFPKDSYESYHEKAVLKKLDDFSQIRIESRDLVSNEVFRHLNNRKIKLRETVGTLLEAIIVEIRKQVIERVLPSLHKKLGGRTVQDSLGNIYDLEGELLLDATMGVELGNGIGLNVAEEMTRFARTNIEASQFLVNKNFRIRTSKITENTAFKLRRSLMIGFSKGEGIESLTSRVDNIVSTNARAIAITEVNGAANFGEFTFAKEYGERFGTDIEKAWLQLPRETKRPDHSVVHGQRRKMHETFKVGGEACLYPHDESLSASQVVRCSCRLDFISGKGVVFQGIRGQNEFARRIIAGSKGEVVPTKPFNPRGIASSISDEKLRSIVGLPSGFEFKGDIYGRKKSVFLLGEIRTKQGKLVGHLSRELRKRNDLPFNFKQGLNGLGIPGSDVVAIHHEIRLMPQFQGKGIVKNHLKSMVPFYESIGVRGIVTIAGGEVGRYAWAKYGFDFVPLEKPQILGKWKKYLKANQVIIEDDVFEKLFVHSWDIASFESEGVKIGKRFLLSEKAWTGFLDLRKGTESRLILSNYIGELDE